MFSELKIDPTAIATPGNSLEQALLHSLENGLDELAEASAIKIKSGDYTTEDIREAMDIMELMAFRVKVRAAAEGTPGVAAVTAALEAEVGQ